MTKTERIAVVVPKIRGGGLERMPIEIAGALTALRHMFEFVLVRSVRLAALDSWCATIHSRGVLS